MVRYFLIEKQDEDFDLIHTELVNVDKIVIIILSEINKHNRLLNEIDEHTEIASDVVKRAIVRMDTLIDNVNYMSSHYLYCHVSSNINSCIFVLLFEIFYFIINNHKYFYLYKLIRNYPWN